MNLVWVSYWGFALQIISHPGPDSSQVNFIYNGTRDQRNGKPIKPWSFQNDLISFLNKKWFTIYIHLMPLASRSWHETIRLPTFGLSGHVKDLGALDLVGHDDCYDDLGKWRAVDLVLGLGKSLEIPGFKSPFAKPRRRSLQLRRKWCWPNFWSLASGSPVKHLSLTVRGSSFEYRYQATGNLLEFHVARCS